MLVTCKNCKVEFNKNNSQVKKSLNHFCSRSCAAKYNNKKFPKRKRRICYCKSCGCVVPYRRTTCDECNPQIVDWTKITLKDVLYTTHQASNRYTRIRDNAQSIFRNSGKLQQCSNCGYSSHYHVCHIKPIHLYSLDTFVSEINSIDNLIALCPNCHWEFDNGLLVPAFGFEPKTDPL